MKRTAAEIVREYGPFPGADHVNGVTYDGQHVWFASGDKLNAFDPASGEAVRSIDVAAHAGTAFDGEHLFRSQRIASRKSIRRTVVCLPPSRRPAAVVTRGSRGPKERCGSGNIAIGRSIKSIPVQGLSCAPSSPTGLSPESPGSTESFGTPPPKGTRARLGESIRELERFWKALKCLRVL